MWLFWEMRYLAVILALLSTAEPVLADKLMLTGNGTVHAALDGKLVHITIDYKIKNEGNVSARQVFPEFRLGTWTWIGPTTMLKAGTSHDWDLNEAFEKTFLQCREGDACAGLILPETGIFPLLITKHYQDLDAYQFSAPSVLTVAVGVSQETLARLSQIPFQASLSFVGDGRQFTGHLKLTNSSSVERLVAVSYHASREILIESKPQVVILPAAGSNDATFQLQNVSALSGSVYPVFVVFQWDEGGVRDSYSISKHVLLKGPKHSPMSAFFVWFTVAIGMLAVLLVFSLLSPTAPIRNQLTRLRRANPS